MKGFIIGLIFAAALLAQKPTGGTGPGGGTGSGNVVGPGSSTTNDCAQFADTTGKLLKDGACSTGTGSSSAYTPVSFSATPAFTALSNTGDAWTITLTGNVTGSTLVSPTSGERLGFQICQDLTGGRIFVWPTGFAAATPISPVASTCTKQEFFWDGVGSNAVPLAKGTADNGPTEFGLEQAAPGTPPANTYYCWSDSTTHVWSCKNNNSSTVSNVAVPISCSSQFLSAMSAAGVFSCAGLTAAEIPTPGSSTPGTSHTFATNGDLFICTSTCTITVPVPALNVQYCVMNDDNVSTVITLSAIGSSARYENTARTAYGTAATGTFVSGGAVGDAVCILGKDSTHYFTVSHVGTWTAN